MRIQPGPDEGKDTYYGVGSVGGRQGRPDANHLRIGGWGDEWFSFLEFPLFDIPEGVNIQKATLNLYNYRSDSNPNAGAVSRVTQYWNESDPSATFQPTSVRLGTGWSPVADDSWWTVDVSDTVQGWVNGVYPNYGFMLQGRYTNNNHVKGFYSSDYMEDPSLRPYLEITYTLSDKQNEVDPLVLQYAPKLALHENENYLPMDTMKFVEASSLWTRDGFDTLLYSVENLTPNMFRNIVENGSTEKYFLSFSSPEDAKIDLISARSTYDALNAEPTIYYAKRDDGNYTVLQYWFFYAMNNWKEQGGLNDHEGDWESVFVFLDRDTKDPKYVAYSAHHNDGDPTLNITQYDSVRREWESNEVVKEDGRPVSFVALGSHANYPNNNGGVHRVFTKTDRTSTQGTMLDTVNLLSGNELTESTPFWMQYEGQWGTDKVDIKDGKSGPKGPLYSTVGGTVRFLNPVAWAGIDKIARYTFGLEDELISFPEQGVSLQFVGALPVGGYIKIDPHDEVISFGALPDQTTLLPRFWDLTSDLENGEFQAEVTFEFDRTEVSAQGGDVRTLEIYYYDPTVEIWKVQDTLLDMEESTVSFQTDHFSRYAVGFTNPEVFVENLFSRLMAIINETALQRPFKKALLQLVRTTERVWGLQYPNAGKVKLRLLKPLERTIDRYAERGWINPQQQKKMQDILGRLRLMVR